MDHDLNVTKGRTECVRIANIAEDVLDVLPQPARSHTMHRGSECIKHAHAVAGLAEGINDVGSNQASAPANEQSHLHLNERWALPLEAHRTHITRDARELLDHGTPPLWFRDE